MKFSFKWPLFSPPDVRNGRDFQYAQEFFKNLEPLATKKEEFDFALEHARGRYEEVTQAFDKLDTKAEKLFVFAGTVAGAIAALGRIAGYSFSWPWIITFVCLAIVMMIAVRVRTPVQRIAPTTTEDLLVHANKMNAAYLKGKVAASYHSACVAVAQINIWKATWLSRSEYVFMAGIVLLIIGFGVTPSSVSNRQFSSEDCAHVQLPNQGDWSPKGSRESEWVPLGRGNSNRNSAR